MIETIQSPAFFFGRFDHDGDRHLDREVNRGGMHCIVRAAGRRGAARRQTANFLARPSGRRLSYSSKGWWIHGLVGSTSQ